jgi:protein ImuA
MSEWFMPIPILDHRPDRTPQMQRLVGNLSLLRGRVHEACGPARRSLAAFLMSYSEGPVLWVQPGWQPERLFPGGLVEFADPGRVIFALARRPEDLLWSVEEALRSGAVPLVLADLPAAPGLTPVRRLHLAAEAGAERARGLRPAPLALLMTPGTGGAAGVETRWHMAPVPGDGPVLASPHPASANWQLTRLRARMAPPANWRVTRQEQGQITIAPA